LTRLVVVLVQDNSSLVGLEGPCVKRQYGGGVVANPHILWSALQEDQDIDAEGGIQTQGSELGVELGGNTSVEC
jgi:hypothetical protein